MSAEEDERTHERLGLWTWTVDAELGLELGDLGLELRDATPARIARRRIDDAHRRRGARSALVRVKRS